MRRVTMARPIGVLLTIACLSLVSVAAAVAAPHTEVVTQNTTTWTQDDTRGGGTVTWTAAYGAPAGLGSSSLQLATTASTADKAGLYTHTMAGTKLADVTDLGYWTYQHQASVPVGDASFQLQVETGCGFTTLVYEPTGTASSSRRAGSSWDMDSRPVLVGRTVTSGTCTRRRRRRRPALLHARAVQGACPERGRRPASASTSARSTRATRSRPTACSSTTRPTTSSSARVRPRRTSARTADGDLQRPRLQEPGRLRELRERRQRLVRSSSFSRISQPAGRP